MKDYLSEFRSYLSLIKKSSANTVESYVRDISKFSDFASQNKVDDITSVSSDFIEKYITYISAAKTESTVTRTISSLRCYYKFLSSIDMCKNIPIESMKTAKSKPDKKLPEILDIDEVRRLLEQPDISDIKGIRDKAMLELMYATGIKVSELISLEIGSVNLQIGVVKIGKDERIVPLYDEALKIISLYISQCRSVIVTDPHEKMLFTNMNGTVLTRQGFWKIIKSYAAKAGIKKDITPHTIRHSFATHLLENGANLEDIKELLGYSDISSAQIYAQIVSNKYRGKYKQFHPMAR